MMQDKEMKKVGIIIPIYNVEKYLRECLDSVLNQTYTNLSIVLVNDGSTDKSLEIAKEYALKDERILIIDKENGGQSSARNAGLKLFYKEYELGFKVKQDQFNIFTISNENSLNIKALYTIKENFEIPQIDYLIFLDSDDYWDLSCIKECVKRMRGVSLVWFDSENFADDMKMQKVLDEYKSFLENYKLDKSKEKIVTFLDLMNHCRFHEFWFCVQGMIDFNYLKKIKLEFKNGIIHEDNLFGILLFSQLDYIYILPKKFYFRRVRADSTMRFSTKDHRKNYHKYYSFFINFLELLKFSEQVDARTRVLIQNIFLPTYAKLSLGIIGFKESLELSDKISLLESFVKDNGIKFGGCASRIKSQLSYRLGELILGSKSFKKFIKLPIVLSREMKLYKQEQKDYKERIKLYPFLKLPPLENYADYNDSKSIYNHLTYKLGHAVVKAQKKWYLGSYLLLPFNLAFISLSHKKEKTREKQVKTNLQDKLQNLISENKIVKTRLDWLISDNRRFYTACKQTSLSYKLQRLQNEWDINTKYHDMIYKVLNQDNAIIVDTSRSYEALARFSLEHEALFYAFEANPYRYKILQKEFRQSSNFTLYPYLAYHKTTNLRLLIQNADFLNASTHLMPDISTVPNSVLINAINFIDTLKELLNKHKKINLLRLNIDRDNEILIHTIIKEKLYQNIDFILCEVKDMVINKELWFKELFELIKCENVGNIFLDIQRETEGLKIMQRQTPKILSKAPIPKISIIIPKSNF